MGTHIWPWYSAVLCSCRPYLSSFIDRMD